MRIRDKLEVWLSVLSRKWKSITARKFQLKISVYEIRRLDLSPIVNLVVKCNIRCF